MKLVFLGDSLTNGSYGGNWVKVVMQALPQHQITNAGVGGDTVLNLRQRVDGILEQYEPDAMFVMVGGNDAVSYLMPDTRLYYKTTKRVPDGIVTPDQFTVAYRDLLTHLQLNYVQAFVGLPPTEYNVELVQARQLYNQLTVQVAESLNVAVLDLATPFIPSQPIQREPVTLKFIQEIGNRAMSGWSDYEAEQKRLGYRYTFDGMHLTPKSAEKMAELVLAFLREQGF